MNWLWYHQRVTYVLLIVSVRGGHHHHHRFHEICLIPNRRNHMTNITVTVGHRVDFTLAFLDQHGNPMLTTPAPDAAPTWTDTTATTGTLSVSPSGLTASELAIAAGADTVSVFLMVGGVAFSASVDLTVQDQPQVLTSIGILGTVS